MCLPVHCGNMRISFFAKTYSPNDVRLFRIDSGKTQFRLSQVATKYNSIHKLAVLFMIRKRIRHIRRNPLFNQIFWEICISPQLPAWLVRDLLQPDGRISNSDWFQNSFIMFVCEKVFFRVVSLGNQILTELTVKQLNFIGNHSMFWIWSEFSLEIWQW